MGAIKDDVRMAVRMLGRNPGFALASVLTLVLGILLNTAVFGITNALWFRPLPFQDDRQVVVIHSHSTAKNLSRPLSRAEFRNVKQRSSTLDGVCAFEERSFAIDGEAVRGGSMTANTLEVLGIRTKLGRAFREGETDVVLVGETLWRNRYGGDAGLVGRTIRVDGKPLVVVGILPREFRFVYGSYGAVTPLAGDGPVQVLGRMRAPLAQVSAELATLGEGGWDPVAVEYRKAVFRHAERMFAVLLACAALVLLIVCANVSGLFLANAAARTREFAVRLALGASRWALMRGMVVQGLVMACGGGLLGLFAAVWLRQVVVASYPELSAFAVDFRVVLYTIAISIAAGVTFGLMPAMAASKPDVVAALKSGGRGSAANVGQRLRKTLVVTELALGVALLAGAGLLAKTMANLRTVEAGFPTGGLAVASVTVEQAHERVWPALASQLSQQAGVRAVTVSSALPLASCSAYGEAHAEGGRSLRLILSSAAPGYAAVLGLPIVAGRDFTASDRGVVLVNELLAKQVSEDAVGKRIRVAGEWRTIVGVVGNARQCLTEVPRAEAIVPVEAQTTLHVIARVDGPPGVLAAALSRTLPPGTPTPVVLTTPDLVDMFYPKVLLQGIGIFAGCATLLGAVGLYGLLSFLVVVQRHDLGVRVALGASRSHILRGVLSESLYLAGAGAGAGLVAALGVARLLRGFLYGIGAAEPVVFAAAAMALTAVSLAAGLVPAWRASRLDPALALRND